MDNTKTSKTGNANLTLWFVGGLYLIYSAYRLFSMYFSGEALEGRSVVFLLIAVAFALLGLYLSVTAAVRYYSKAAGADGAAEAEQAAEPGLPDAGADGPLLGGALEDIGACVRERRDIMETFNSGEYADGFAAYLAEVRSVFEKTLSCEEAPERIGELLSRRLLAELGAEYSSLPARAAEKAKETDKQVMAFYLVPAAASLGLPGCEEFIAALVSGWNGLYPQQSFSAGRYEDILAGFEKRLSRAFGFK